MKYEKNDVITFNDGSKVVVLETLNYDGFLYLYVDKLDYTEENNLNEFHILREDNNTMYKEVDPNVLSKLLPLFNNKISIASE